MPLRPRSFLGRLRAGVDRSIRRAGSWIGPQDPASLAGRLDKGEIVWRAFVDAGTAMHRCNRFADADRMLERGLGAFADDPTLLYEYAMSAHNSGRYDLAVPRWERALLAASALAVDQAAMCHCGLAANLRHTGVLDRAQRVIDNARQLFPQDLIVISEAARVADACGAVEQALALWRMAAASPNAPPEWLQGEISALLRLGRWPEAERALTRGRSRFPEAPGLLGAEGLLAAAREDWPKAVASWTAYRARFPDDRVGRDQLAHALDASRRSTSGRDAAAPPPSAPHNQEPFLRSFESIGDDCEFGLVQRRYAVEPAGLLSWSTLTLDALVSALDDRLSGLGEAENSELVLQPGGEYVVRDRRWQLGFHTAAFAGQAERDTLFANTCRRIAGLRNRLLADLAAAEKTFVYRSDGLDGDRLELLHRTLRRFGPVRLLAVQPAAPTAPTLFQGRAGDVLQLDKGCFVGFLERLGAVGSGEGQRDVTSPDIPFEDWLAVCRKTAAMA